MPLLDFETCPSEALAGHEILIVGAGAAGIFLALTLARLGKRVLLLETGRLELDDDRQSLNQIEETGKALSAAVWGRKRVVGGTTTAWGGQSLPFSPLDFTARPWVPLSGWPLAWSEVEPGYGPANDFLGVDRLDYEHGLGRVLRRPDPGFDPALARYHFSKWSPRPDFRRARLAELKRRVTLVIDAHVVALHPGPDRRVSSIEIAGWNGRRLRLPVNQLVLAQGGIETCRQLLLSARAHPGLFGDASGWLGHAFMEHPSIDAGALIAPDPEALQRIFGARVRHGRKYSVRLSTPEVWQRSRSLLNASATFFPRYPAGTDSPYATLRRFLRRPSAAGLRPAASAAARLPRALAVLLRRGLVLQPGAQLRLAMMVEQAPDRSNRLTLADAADHFGQPRASLRWRVGENSWRTLHAFVHTVDRELARLGLGRVSMPPELAGPEPGSPADALLSDVNHHMGGARLGARPEDGVVSPDLRLWSQENVFVCSTAVFPTGSHSNPTLTLLALAHRLARHLSR